MCEERVDEWGEYLCFVLGFLMNGNRGVLRILSAVDRFCSNVFFTKLSHKNSSLMSVRGIPASSHTSL